MKNFTRLFIFVLALTSLAVSQSFAAKRMVLIEEATNASCGPCAQSNPFFKMWVGQHLDRVIPVTIHSSWPGATDPMYLDIKSWSDERVQNYYEIIGVPAAEINGLPKGDKSQNINSGIFPLYTTLLQQEVDKYPEDSPITLGITETKSGSHVTIKIDVTSTESLTGKKLRVYAVENHHNYPNAGNNGEKDFEWVVRKALPTINGDNLTLDANDSKSFTYDYDIASTWTTDQMYVVAFVQDDATREVLQAATNAKFVSARMSITDFYNKIPRNGSFSKPVTVTNISNTKATFNVAIDTKLITMPVGWTGKVEPASVTLEPGASQDVNVTLTSAADKAYYASTIVTVTPANLSGYYEAISGDYYNTLTEDAKYVIYADNDPYAGTLYPGIAAQLATYSKDFVTLSNSNQTQLAAYPPENFDAAVYVARTQYPATGYIYPIFNPDANNILTMINAGKDVFIISDCSAGFASQLTGFNSIMTMLGITASEARKERATFNGTTKPAAAETFSVAGISGDSVGNGITATGNQYWTNGYFTWWTDVLSINSGSISKPVLYYDNDKKALAAIRAQIGKSKIVFMTVGFEALISPTSSTNGNKILKAVMDWFSAAEGPQKLGPVIAVSETSAAFDSVEVGKTKDIDITVTNKGDEDLIINQVYNDEVWDPDGVFSVVKGNTGLPLTIKPNQGSLVITVRFTPKSVKKYTDGDAGSLVIKSNNKEGEEQDIELSGIGAEPKTSVEESTSANGLVTVNAWPNVFSTSTNVTVAIGGQKTRNVELTVIDETGRTVATLANEAMAPGQITREFNAGALASGTYYVIATTDGTAVRIPVKIAR